MKKLLFSAMLLTAVSLAGSAAPEDCRMSPMTAERNISESIRSQIKVPEFMKENEGEREATIVFKVNTCGTISVQQILTTDEELRTDLLSQAGAMRVATTACLDSRDTYRVVIRFKPL